MHVRTRVSVRACAHVRECLCGYVYVFACAALLGDEEDFVRSSAMLCLAKVRQSRTLLTDLLVNAARAHRRVRSRARNDGRVRARMHG